MMYFERIAIDLAIYVIMTVALNLSSGFTGVFSLGHIGFMAVGAYTSALLTMDPATKAMNLPDLPAWLTQVHLPFPVALVLAGLLAAAIGLAVGVPILRLSGHYVAVATMGFLVIVHVVAINWDAITRGARTFLGVPDYTNNTWAWGWVAVTIFTVWRVGASPFGRYMRAMREDLVAAQSVGIDIMRTRLLAFSISAFFTAVAGGLWAHHITAFSPQAFYFDITFRVIVMLVVGGIGSIPGSVLGAVVLTVLSELLRKVEQGGGFLGVSLPPLYGLSQILLSAGFVLLMVFRPGGILGGGRRIRKGGVSASRT